MAGNVSMLRLRVSVSSSIKSCHVLESCVGDSDGRAANAHNELIRVLRSHG
jgi:hypothetical protein